MTRLYRLLTSGALILVLLFVLKGGANNGASAQAAFHVYFPMMHQPEPVRFDDFADEDPVWHVVNMQSPSDSFFRHERGVLYAEIRDNADRYVAWPGWRPMGDFKLEVDARFDPVTPSFQTRNGLGLVFGGSNGWWQQYAYILGYWGSQPAWGLTRYDGKKENGDDIKHKISAFGGAPGSCKGHDSWNHLAVVRIRDLIYLYCNGGTMPAEPPDYTYFRDGTYGTNRLVGLMISSWEADFDRIEFDNFMLTPLSMPY